MHKGKHTRANIHAHNEHTRTHTHTYTDTHIHPHIYTYTHTHYTTQHQTMHTVIDIFENDLITTNVVITFDSGKLIKYTVVLCYFHFHCI